MMKKQRKNILMLMLGLFSFFFGVIGLADVINTARIYGWGAVYGEAGGLFGLLPEPIWSIGFFVLGIILIVYSTIKVIQNKK